MKGLRPRMACVGLVCAVGVWTCPEVDAQSTAARSTGSGIMMVPVPMPLFPPAVSNGSSDSGPAAGGMSAQANVFSNPVCRGLSLQQHVTAIAGANSGGVLAGNARRLTRGGHGLITGPDGLDDALHPETHGDRIGAVERDKDRSGRRPTSVAQPDDDPSNEGTIADRGPTGRSRG
jgi:hypothetical protein